MTRLDGDGRLSSRAGGGADWDPPLCMSVAGQVPALLGMGDWRR